MDKIFISYSRKDMDFARKLAGDLEKAGYDVWWDITDLRGGDDWVRTIPANIGDSKYMIVVLTPNSVESEWVRKEYTQALNLRKKIIPIMLVPTPVPFALNTINFVNFATGEYEDNFKNLLSPLGFSGKAPEVTPYKKPLPPAFFKYGIPSMIGLIILLAFIFISRMNPPETPTITPTLTITSSPTFTTTPKPSSTPANTATNSIASQTLTAEAPTATFSPTPLPRIFPLPICIYYSNVPISGELVRERPNNNTGSYTLGQLKRDGTNCPFFSAFIENDENEIWYQFASDGQKAEFEQYAGRWIYGYNPPAVNPGTLPLCIYSRSVSNVFVFEGPGSESNNRKGTPLDADGTNCPFFRVSETKENEGKVWYQFAHDQKGVTDIFGVYADGWISSEYLALPEYFISSSVSRKLPAVTLTPTFIASSTPIITASPTATNTFTPTNTSTPTQTETAAP